ncbi:MAG: hypothetical protein M3295_02860 [Chloroflexota bacterium]|nr:hypothetical protein [Chloroflexota bacterium]
MSEHAPLPEIRATGETLPFGAVTNERTDGWAVIHVPTLEVVRGALYPSVDAALAAAAEARAQTDAEARANRFFDEERWIHDRRHDDE